MWPRVRMPRMRLEPGEPGADARHPAYVAIRL
jgi:hypothetical protein